MSFELPGHHLKHRFLYQNQVAFWAGQEAENVPGDQLKHRFINLTEVAF